MFSTGDTVRTTGSTTTGDVGTVVHHDASRDLHLVRVDAVTQHCFGASELQLYTA